MVHSFRSSRPGKPRSIWLIVVNIPALDKCDWLVRSWPNDLLLHNRPAKRRHFVESFAGSRVCGGKIY